MTRRTHVVFNAAITTVVLKPLRYKELFVDLVFSTIGSIICDIDVSTSSSRKDVKIISSISLFLIISFLFIDYFYNFGFINTIKNRNDIFIKILDFLFIILVCAHGMHKPHRTFMHSFLGVFILSFLLFFMYRSGVIPFAVGMLSHIFLDFFNHRKIQLFYPFKNKHSLDICSSNGIINDFIFSFSIFILIFL